MAVKLIDEVYCPHVDDYRRTYIMDSDDDAASLPSCCPGSFAIVANEGGGVYMTNTSGEWRKQ
jgi:hypothetical protein